MNTKKKIISDTIYTAIISYKCRLIDERKSMLDRRGKELKLLETTLHSLLDHVEDKEKSQEFIDKTLEELRAEFISNILYFNEQLEEIDNYLSDNIFERESDKYM